MVFVHFCSLRSSYLDLFLVWGSYGQSKELGELVLHLASSVASY